MRKVALFRDAGAPHRLRRATDVSIVDVASRHEANALAIYKKKKALFVVAYGTAGNSLHS